MCVFVIMCVCVACVFIGYTRSETYHMLFPISYRLQVTLLNSMNSNDMTLWKGNTVQSSQM